MNELIECNPEILGGKPVIKGTRIPVRIIFELLGLKYSIDEIIEEYPTLNRGIIEQLIEIARDAQKNLCGVNLDQYPHKETIIS